LRSSCVLAICRHAVHKCFCLLLAESQVRLALPTVCGVRVAKPCSPAAGITLSVARSDECSGCLLVLAALNEEIEAQPAVWEGDLLYRIFQLLVPELGAEPVPIKLLFCATTDMKLMGLMLGFGTAIAAARFFNIWNR
jgi:hypothetical protein